MKIKSCLIILALLTFITVSGCMENSSEISGESNSSGDGSASITSATVSENDVLY